MELKKAIEKIKKEFGDSVKITELEEPSNYYPGGWGHFNAKRKLEKKYITNSNYQYVISKHFENNRFWWFLVERNKK